MYLDKVYHIVNNSITQELCSNIISQGESKELKTGEILDGKQFNRSSKVSWIENRHLELQLMQSIRLANRKADWDFSLAEFEPFQYTVYNKDDFYNWHIDSLSEPYDNGYIRKLSFTLSLNDNYEGGAFDITVPNPKEDDNEKYTIDLRGFKPGTLLVFPSFMWHRVNKVRKGTRKVLVGWTLGKQWS
jgi:PKHD-type hydroxylase